MDEPALPPRGFPFTRNGQQITTDVPVHPQQHGQVLLSYVLRGRRTPGTVFDFAGTFCAYKDVGQSRAALTRCYPVAFPGLHP